MKNFELLLDVIPPYPGQNIAIIENSQDEIVDVLNLYCKKIGAALHVKTLGERKNNINENIRIKSFSFEQARYNTFAVDYDFLFLCVDISQRGDVQTVFKKIYRVMKNAGELFVFIKKDEITRYFEILEDTNYVAINSIDLNDSVEVVIAKKMHGWRKV